MLEVVTVSIASSIEAECFRCKYLCHTSCMRVAEAVFDAYVAEQNELFYKQAFSVGVGVVVVVVACVLVNIILMGAACYHLPGNEPTTISHTQNVAMCTACKLIYHVTHITVKPQKPLTISGKCYYGDIVAY